MIRCGSNAKAYARNLRVVGVVGSFQSPCSYVQIPVTNQAADGPLAMISPSNTYQGLTEEDDLYPTGVRSYVRIAGSVHRQAVAHAELETQSGALQIFLQGVKGQGVVEGGESTSEISGGLLGGGEGGEAANG